MSGISPDKKTIINIVNSATFRTILATVLKSQLTSDESVIATVDNLINELLKNIDVVNIADNVIQTSNIVNNAITSEKIAPNSINNSHLSNNSVTSEKIASNAVITANLANNAITSVKIAPSSINTIHLATGSVTMPALASDVKSTFDLTSITSKVNNIESYLKALSSTYRIIDSNGREVSFN